MQSLDIWIKMQRIEFAAFFLMAKLDNVDIADMIYLLRNELLSESQDFFYFINPSTWHRLLEISPTMLSLDLKENRYLWEKHLSRLINHSTDGKLSHFNAAKIIAYHIMHTKARAQFILRLFISVLSKSWRPYLKDSELIDAMDQSLEIIRLYSSDTRQKIDAIDKIGEIIQDRTHKNLFTSWRMIESILIHHLLSWPLLVNKDDKKAISLPVGIDVYFDGKGKDNTPFINSHENNLIDLSDWEDNLRTAINAAKILWRGKHGNYGEFRDKVESASVVFDLSIAEMIIKEMIPPLKPQHGSMEAYFSQVILCRLLGKKSFVSSAVTGLIGDQRKDAYKQEMMDFEFNWPADVPRKIEYIYHTHSFERVVLPQLNDNDPREIELSNFISDNKFQQNVEINRAKYLQHVAPIKHI